MRTGLARARSPTCGIHYTMKKPFQGCDDKHAPICARWHAARAAMDAADWRNVRHRRRAPGGRWRLATGRCCRSIRKTITVAGSPTSCASAPRR